MTQTEIAKQIGVSQMQVSRILRRATDQLRETMALEDSSSRNGDAS
jgi:DNA-directed RNA polymerase specialized sigma subunit